MWRLEDNFVDLVLPSTFMWVLGNESRSSDLNHSRPYVLSHLVGLVLLWDRLNYVTMTSLKLMTFLSLSLLSAECATISDFSVLRPPFFFFLNRPFNSSTESENWCNSGWTIGHRFFPPTFYLCSVLVCYIEAFIAFLLTSQISLGWRNIFHDWQIL